MSHSNSLYPKWIKLILLLSLILITGCSSSGGDDDDDDDDDDHSSPTALVEVTAITSDDQISFSWTNPTDDDFAGVMIRRSTTDFPADATDGTEVYRGDAEQFIDTDLDPGTYYYSFHTFDDDNDYSPPGRLALNVVEQSLDMVDNLGVALDRGDLTLTWTNPVDPEFITTMIRHSLASQPLLPTDGDEVLNADAESYSVAGLSVDTHYYAFFTFYSDGSHSDPLQVAVSVPDTTPPAPVSSLVATPSPDREVTLTWVNPTDTDFAGVVVRRSASSFPQTADQGDEIYRGVGTMVVDSNLSIGDYFYSVFTYDAVPNHSPATSVQVAVVDETPPAAVTDFTAQATADFELSLSWQNPVDSDFSHVVIERRNDQFPTAPDDGVEVYSGSGNSLVEPSLPAGNYYYAAFAFDHVGNQSDIATASAIAADITAPAIVTQDPAHQATDVDKGAEFSISFNESLVADNSYRIRIYREPDGLQVWNGYLISYFVAGSNNQQLRFTPGAYNFEFDTTYSITLDAADSVGNTLVIARGDWQFTTGPDNEAPTVTYRYPSANATNISVSPLIRVRFSEDVAPVTTWEDAISIDNGITGSVIFNSSVNEIQFTPDDYLPHNTLITVSVQDVQDVAGNAMAPYSWSFTTKQAVLPTIIERIPEDGQPLVGTNAEVSIKFDKTMDASTINASNIYIINVASTVSYNEGSRTATITPNSNLNANSSYTVRVLGANLRDNEGLAMAGSVQWSFRTSGTTVKLSPTTSPVAYPIDMKFNDSGQGLAITLLDSAMGYRVIYNLHNGTNWSGRGTIYSRTRAYPYYTTFSDSNYPEIAVAGDNLVWAIYKGDWETELVTYNGSTLDRQTVPGIVKSIESNGSEILVLTYESVSSTYQIHAHVLDSNGWSTWDWTGLGSGSGNGISTSNIYASGHTANATPFMFTVIENFGNTSYIKVAKYDGGNWTTETIHTESSNQLSISAVRVASTPTEYVVAYLERSTVSVSSGVRSLKFYRLTNAGWQTGVTVIDNYLKDVSDRANSFDFISNGSDFLLGYIYEESDAGSTSYSTHVETSRIVNGAVTGTTIHYTESNYISYESMKLYTNGGSYMAVWNASSTHMSAISPSAGFWQDSLDVGTNHKVTASGAYYAVTITDFTYRSGGQPYLDELKTYAHINNVGWSAALTHVAEDRGDYMYLPLGAIAAKGGNSFQVVWANDSPGTKLYQQSFDAVLVTNPIRSVIVPSTSTQLTFTSISGGVLAKPEVLVNGNRGVMVWPQRNVRETRYYFSRLVPGSGASPSTWSTPIMRAEFTDMPAVTYTGTQYVFVWMDGKILKEVRYNPSINVWSTVTDVADLSGSSGNAESKTAIASNGSSLVALAKIGSSLKLVESQNGSSWGSPFSYSASGDGFTITSDGSDYMVAYGVGSYSSYYVNAIHIDGTDFAKTLATVDNVSTVYSDDIEVVATTNGFAAVWAYRADNYYYGVKYRFHDGADWLGTGAQSIYSVRYRGIFDLRVAGDGDNQYVSWTSPSASGFDVPSNGYFAAIDSQGSSSFPLGTDHLPGGVAAFQSNYGLAVEIDKTGTLHTVRSYFYNDDEFIDTESDIYNTKDLYNEFMDLVLPQNDASIIFTRGNSGYNSLYYSTSPIQ